MHWLPYHSQLRTLWYEWLMGADSWETSASERALLDKQQHEHDVVTADAKWGLSLCPFLY